MIQRQIIVVCPRCIEQTPIQDKCANCNGDLTKEAYDDRKLDLSELNRMLALQDNREVPHA